MVLSLGLLRWNGLIVRSWTTRPQMTCGTLSPEWTKPGWSIKRKSENVASLRVFGQRIAKVAKGMEAKLNRKMIGMAITIEQTLVLATPVDTGRARANWQVTLDTPAKTEVSSSGGNAQVGFVRDEAGRFAKRYPSAQETIARAMGTLTHRRPEQNIFISNNVPYIGRLNEGWSAQAPAGFIEQAVQAAVAAHRGDKLL